jgi:hypothetical protein
MALAAPTQDMRRLDESAFALCDKADEKSTPVVGLGALEFLCRDPTLGATRREARERADSDSWPNGKNSA